MTPEDHGQATTTRKARLSNVHIEPYTWKAIAASSAAALAAIATELARIANALERR